MKNYDIFTKTTKRKFLKIFGVSLLGSLGYGLFTHKKSQIDKTYWQGSVLGAPAKIEIHSKDRMLNKHLVTEIDKLIFKYENIFNLQNVNSEITHLNKNKSLISPSQELSEVIKKSVFMADSTNGLFDITVQPLWNLYYEHFIINNDNTPLDTNKIKNALNLVNWRNIEVNEDKITLHGNSSITLNGIAQGWITDKITDLLSNYGLNNTLVDFGENYALGLYEKSRPWNILIKGNDAEKIVSLSNKAIATSGGYGTSFEPTLKNHHIFNTKTGKSSNNFKAVSIISDKAWLSDALSTASLSMEVISLKNLCTKLEAKAYIQKDKHFTELA